MEILYYLEVNKKINIFMKKIMIKYKNSHKLYKNKQTLNIFLPTHIKLIKILHLPPLHTKLILIQPYKNQYIHTPLLNNLVHINMKVLKNKVEILQTYTVLHNFNPKLILR